MSRIEPMNRRKTSNTQHPTSNNQWFPIGPLIGGWVLDVGCWMFDVPKGSWREESLHQPVTANGRHHRRAHSDPSPNNNMMPPESPNHRQQNGSNGDWA